MRNPLGLAIAALILVVTACSPKEAPPDPAASPVVAPVSSCDGGPATPPPAPTFGEGTALIDTGENTVLVKVEIAQTDEQRQFGLMFRDELPANAGMVFVFFDENEGGFYMKDTYLPLSIAYFDVDGKILRIVDMEPCEVDSSLYDPGVAYHGTLEVNRGSFERWGVDEGDVIDLVPREPGQ